MRAAQGPGICLGEQTEAASDGGVGMGSRIWESRAGRRAQASECYNYQMGPKNALTPGGVRLPGVAIVTSSSRPMAPKNPRVPLCPSLSNHSASECIRCMGNIADADQRNAGRHVCAVDSNSHLFGAADNQPVGSSGPRPSARQFAISFGNGSRMTF